jgi:nitroreductase/FMN reductase [NAD(P)H]
MPWIADAPVFLVFLANNRRQRQLAQWRNKPWPNDHLDPFFNATVDTAIALGFFIVAAEAVGLGCCPISVIRNHSQAVSDLLELPDHVIPVAGLAVGWPQFATPRITPRLSPRTTLHVDRFDDREVEAEIDAYDARRRAILPYREQRRADVFGTDPLYGWSEEKARHYSLPERADFGAFVRRKGFRLD